MFYKQRSLENVKKIAVLRANALGDLIVTLPAFKAIRSAYPEAEIILLGRPWHKEFLINGRTSIDRVIVVPVKKGIRHEAGQIEDEQTTEQFFKNMQQEQFDIAVSFQGNGKVSNSFIKRLNAGLTVGTVCNGSEALNRSIDYYYYQSEVIRYLEVAGLIGGIPSGLEPEVNVLEQDREEIRPLLSSLSKPYIVLHPVAMDVRRMWPLKNYAPLADALKKKGCEVIFTGGPADRKQIDEIINEMNYTAVNTAGEFSLGGLTALLFRATFVIAPDTGPLHLARAVNTPTVGIYWAPNLINWGPLTRSIHRPVVSWHMPCPLCGVVPNDPYPFEPRQFCDHEVSFVRDVTVEEVLKNAEDLLEAGYCKKKNDNVYT